MKRELIRITFVGDIMCERPLLKEIGRAHV